MVFVHPVTKTKGGSVVTVARVRWVWRHGEQVKRGDGPNYIHRGLQSFILALCALQCCAYTVVVAVVFCPPCAVFTVVAAVREQRRVYRRWWCVCGRTVAVVVRQLPSSTPPLLPLLSAAGVTALFSSMPWWRQPWQNARTHERTAHHPPSHQWHPIVVNFITFHHRLSTPPRRLPQHRSCCSTVRRTLLA